MNIDKSIRDYICSSSWIPDNIARPLYTPYKPKKGTLEYYAKLYTDSIKVGRVSTEDAKLWDNSTDGSSIYRWCDPT